MKRKNKTIVITGAGSGLGRDLALLAANKGYNVALIGRSEDKLIETKDLVQNNHGPLAYVYPADLTNEQDTQNIFVEISKNHGQPRALVNCVAKWMGRKSSKDIKSSELYESISVNCMTAFYSISETLKIWELFRNDLAIVNVGATSSLAGRANTLAFGLGKVALRTLSQSLAKELGPQGIHVSHIIVDGLLDNPRTKSLSPDVSQECFMNQLHVAESIMFLIEQERSCWTFELDVRPFNERF